MIPSKLVPFLLIISLLVLLAGFVVQHHHPSLLPAALGGSSGPFEGIIKLHTTSAYGDGDLTYTIKGHMIRLDSPGGIFSIVDSKTGISTGVTPSNKTYMVMNVKDLATGVAKSMMQNIKSTGKTETIAGVQCEHYTVEGNFKSDMCIAKNLIPNANTSSFFKNIQLPDDLKNGGFVLKADSLMGGMKTTMLVTSIERKSVDDSLFAIPAGYKKMEMPKMPGINQ